MDLRGISRLSEAWTRLFQAVSVGQMAASRIDEGGAGNAGPLLELSTIMHVVVGLWRAQVRSSKVAVSVIVQEGSNYR